MAFYILYRIGYYISNSIPLRFSYGLASIFAYICYLASYQDRRAVIKNLETITAHAAEKSVLRRMARELYRNFAKYLVDFFRASRIDEDYVKKFVRVEGAANIDAALAAGKGVIFLSAHMGNWELGASVVSVIGYPASAVVRPHKNKRVDDFFKKQRLAGKLTPIEMGMALKSCYKVLTANKTLALLGDRDFSGNGLMLDFFGKKTLFPKGASVFSYRMGSAIVPTLITRRPDDTFHMTFEEPIYADRKKPEDEAILELGKKCAAIIETYVKRYPTQWYVFKDMWSKDE